MAQSLEREPEWFHSIPISTQMRARGDEYIGRAVTD
jgi:hypothetical protein